MVGYSEMETLETVADFRRAEFSPLRAAAVAGQGTHGPGFGSLLMPSGFAEEVVVRVPFEKSSLNGPHIVLPSFEIARAWFLRDSLLTLHLLSSPLRGVLNAMRAEDETSIDYGRKLTLALKDGVGAAAVPIIAMLITSKFAREQASGIRMRLTAAHLRGEPMRISALPPIRRHASIRAVGEWKTVRGRNVFFASWITAIELPRLPEIVWFRKGEESENSQGEGESRFATQGPLMRENVHIVHSREPTKKHSFQTVLTGGAELLNAPHITKRVETVTGAPMVMAPQVQTPELRSTSVEVATGMARSWREGPTGAKYETVPAEAHTDQGRLLLPAGFPEVSRVALKISEDPEMSVGSISGSFFVDDPSGFRRTLLGQFPLWAQVAGRPRQALCLEIGFRETYFYLFELERRSPGEELAACLLGRLNGDRFRQGDVDRILMACARNRGSWRSVHDPFWKRTLAHKFKTEVTFAEKVRALIRDPQRVLSGVRKTTRSRQ